MGIRPAHPRAGRPGAADLIRLAATDVHIAAPGGLILALARIGGYPCVVIAQDRHGPPPGPAALRQARRGARLATGLRLPLVTVIDTPGAELSPRPSRTAWPARSPTAWPTSSRSGSPPSRSCSGREQAARPWPSCPPTASSPPSTPGSPRWRPKAPAPSSTATAATPQNSPPARASAPPTSPPTASSTSVIPETPGRPGRFGRDLGHALHRALEDLANQDDDTRLAGRLRRYRRLGMSPHRRPLPAPPLLDRLPAAQIRDLARLEFIAAGQGIIA